MTKRERNPTGCHHEPYLSLCLLHVAFGAVEIPVLSSEEGSVECRNLVGEIGDVVRCQDEGAVLLSVSPGLAPANHYLQERTRNLICHPVSPDLHFRTL